MMSNNEPGVSEAEYLKQQADAACDAMYRTAKDLAVNLKTAMDPRLWAGEHPWVALGSATLAGLVAGITLIPSQEQQNTQKCAEFNQKIPPNTPAQPASNGESHSSSKSSMVGFLAKQILASLQPALLSVLAARGAKPETKTETAEDADAACNI